MYTWGRNQFGQLGHDDTKDQYFPKLVDIQFVYFVDMAGGYFHSVAISGTQTDQICLVSNLYGIF